MKATFEVPDDLYRRVKAKSALERRPVRAVVIELLGEWLEGTRDLAQPVIEEAEAAKERYPDWFASLRSYGRRAGLLHDLESVRRSIERGLEAESPKGHGNS